MNVSEVRCVDVVTHEDGAQSGNIGYWVSGKKVRRPTVQTRMTTFLLLVPLSPYVRASTAALLLLIAGSRGLWCERVDWLGTICTSAVDLVGQLTLRKLTSMRCHSSRQASGASPLLVFSRQSERILVYSVRFSSRICSLALSR